MEHNSEFSMQDIMRLAQSPAGRQLFALLQQQNSPALQQIVSSASSGDYQSAKETLLTMLNSPEAQALLKQLGR